MKHKSGSKFNDELKWADNETKFLDKYAPFLHHRLVPRILIVLILLAIMLLFFFKIFLTLLFIFIVSYIRFKRAKKGLFIEIEPSYLFGIALTLAFGIEYAIIYILIPAILSGATDGFGGPLLINAANKFIVFLSVYYFWEFTHNLNYIIFLQLPWSRLQI